MKLRQKNLILMGGIIATVLGISVMIPSILKENYLVSTLSGFLLVFGLILLAISLGED